MSTYLAVYLLHIAGLGEDNHLRWYLKDVWCRKVNEKRIGTQRNISGELWDAVFCPAGRLITSLADP